MEPNPGIAAVQMLARLGYQFTLAGGTIKAKYRGHGKPDLDTVRPLLEVVRVNKPHVVDYLSKSPPPYPPQTCESCPSYELNPWTHYPNFGAWCHREMKHLVAGTPACEKFNRGEVAIPNTVPQAPAPRDRVLTCFECPRHEHDRINPSQGWGRCTLKNRGCYGLRPACSEIPPRDTDVPLDG